MKLDDPMTVYVLYGCNLSKERGSRRVAAATTDKEMLHTIIGAQILGGTMDYRGFSNMKGFEQFRAACRAGDVRYSDLDYGFVEQTENLMLPDCAKEPQLEKAYRLLNLSDREFNAIRSGSLENLGADRTRLILDKALSWAAQNYTGWDLYQHLREKLGMSNEEIGQAGFDLDEYYEEETPEDESDYEPEDDYEEELLYLAPAGTLLYGPPQLRAAHRGPTRRNGLLPLCLLHRRPRLQPSPGKLPQHP